MMGKPIKVFYRGDGLFQTASDHWTREADSQFGAGELTMLVRHEDRSMNSHRHYFSILNEAWQTLPDTLLEEYPSVEHLRKKMLIRCGYADERSIVCATKAEAQRVAAFVKPMDDYAVVTVREAVVRVYTAQSQSMKAMGAKTFQESKVKVLDAVADLLGVERDQFGRAA